MLNIVSIDEQLLQEAQVHQRAGRWPQAEALYRQVLQRDPGHVGALHQLGIMATQAQRHDIALDLMRQVIALRPDYAEAYNTLGNLLLQMGRLDEAIAGYQQAIAFKPQY